MKNWFLSFFLLALFFLPFFNPNKYNTIEVIRGSDIALTEFNEGYYLGYGLHTSNVLLAFACGFLLKDLLTSKRKGFVGVFKKRSIFAIFFLWSIFAVIGALVSASNSFSAQASIIWLLQYSQFIVFAFCILIIGKLYKSSLKLVFVCIAMMVLLQSLLAVHQFILQSNTGHIVEFGYGSSFFTGGDENNSLFRVNGTYLFHNQFALLQLILCICILPLHLRNQNKILGILILLGMVTGFLAQSRIIWITYVFVYFLTYYLYKPQIVIIASTVQRKSMISGVLIMFLVAYVFVPRFLLSFNTFTPGSSGTIRMKMLDEAVQALQINPLFGYGVGTNEYILHGLFPQGVMSVFPAAVHLGFLQMALEVGLVGLFFLVFPFMYLFRSLFVHVTTKSKNHEFVDFSYIFLSGSVVFCLYYLFQPHVGIMEFPFLGIISGFGLLARHDITENV